MDFELTNQHRLARATARDVARTELAPYAQEWDQTMTFPGEALKKLARLGFMGISIPKAYGGCGLDSISYVLIIEELAKVCASTAIIVSVHNSVCAYPIFMLGTEEQKQSYLVPLSRGEKLGAFALTEPNAGSDPASLETVAERHGDHFILNGTKTFITNGSTADIVLVMARTDRTKRSRGITAFIVDKSFGGIIVGSKENKLGIRASDTCELIFKRCTVPAANVLGELGAGLGAALDTLTFGRVGVAAQALGVAECAFEESIRYSTQRKQFGRPIADFQAIQWMLADMATEIEAARSLVYRAAWLKDRGKPFAAEASMAKLYASETAMRCATKAVQIHGGYGCMKDYRVERCFRDAKVIEIYEGTSEIQRLIIARNVTK
ncbi:MAG: acyl-CoA dehydrogenase [Desulfobacterota bacterium]|nr:acyl-CoA dehydrogenase [Thermodesulfobacteriota bacterium]